MLVVLVHMAILKLMKTGPTLQLPSFYALQDTKHLFLFAFQQCWDLVAHLILFAMCEVLPLAFTLKKACLIWVSMAR